MMSEGKTLNILTEDKIQRILKRMSIQILENNLEVSKVVLVGIKGQGYQMALRLQKMFESVHDGSLTCDLAELTIDKKNPVEGDISLSVDLDRLNDQIVVLVDDVINTGRTQAYGIKFLLTAAIKKLETAILIDRSHKLFPVSTSYCGLALSTTLEEHVEVSFETGKGAFLY
ncbi:MAG: phosphoribosyltransferase [Flammeovirgaceae bacterium]|nr:phosphoribosyltransferase [Flammeovirgaceae bacterium]|tara:strand:+ start:2726 stop:3241 length:516 start_codon:yes stop_codon:yes gene_type:complete